MRASPTILCDNDLILIDGIDSNISSGRTCPKLEDEEHDLIETFEYWIGGVGVCIFAVPGMVFSLIAIFHFLTKSSTRRNTFNSLLITLFSWDIIYLLCETLETLRRQFNLGTRIHMILIPKFTYPLLFISLSASIFMTVGVSHERYAAVKNPILHRQHMQSAKFRRRKLLAYVLTVCILAVIFNLPKFYEVELEWENNTTLRKNGTDQG